MKKGAILLMAIIVSVPLGLTAQDETFFPYSFARLSYVNGDVYVQRASDLGYEKGEINLALVQGDKIGTEQGQAEVHFGRRNYLRLDAQTRVEFALLPSEGQEYLKIHLLEGRAYLRVAALVEDKGIELHTPDASFYILEEGLFRFDVSAERMTRVFVHEGSLEAASESGSVMVRSLEFISAADGRLLGDPDYFYSDNDEFDAWNRSRDTLLARRNDRQYLPQELDAYEEELGDSGTWVYERPYGYVWVPIISEPSWRPYLFGRWVWYPVIGWNWVSSEPWGWAVYHYGRWHWRVGLGWYWIPHHHWRPAWVHWWWDRDYIGWCPLGWYNRPIVVINNYFYDRHFDASFPAHNRALTVVRRNQLQAPQVHRHQLAQTELNRISKVSLKARQPDIRPSVNNAGPQASAAQRVLSARPGEHVGLKNIPSSRALTPSRVGPRGEASGTRTPTRIAAPPSSAVGKGALSSSGSAGRPRGVSDGSAPRDIRSYPSRKTTGFGQQSGVPERRPPVMRGTDAGTNSERRPGAGRSPSTVRQPPSSSKTEPGSAAQKIKKNEGQSAGTPVKKGETIKKYPSSQASASSVRSSTLATSDRRSLSRSSQPTAGYPSRLSPSSSGRSPASDRTAVSPRGSSGRLDSSRASSLAGRSSAAGRASRVTSPSSRRTGSGSSSRSILSRPSTSSRPSGSMSSPSRATGASVRSSRGSSPKASSSRPSSSASSSRSSSRTSGSVKKKDS